MTNIEGSGVSRAMFASSARCRLIRSSLSPSRLQPSPFTVRGAGHDLRPRGANVIRSHLWLDPADQVPVRPHGVSGCPSPLRPTISTSSAVMKRTNVHCYPPSGTRSNPRPLHAPAREGPLSRQASGGRSQAVTEKATKREKVDVSGTPGVSVAGASLLVDFALAATGARMSVMTRCRETGA